MKGKQPSIIQLRFESEEYGPLRRTYEKGECSRESVELCIVLDYLDQESGKVNLENN